MYTMCDCLVLNEYYDRAGSYVHIGIDRLNYIVSVQ